MRSTSENKMSQMERRELRNLVDETFAYLKAELAQRENQVRQIIEDRIMAEHHEDMQSVRNEFRKAIEFASKCDITVRVERGYSDAKLKAPEDLILKPEGLDDRMEAEMKKVRAEAAKGTMSLEQEKLRIRRDITLTAITSAGARAMVDAIPKLDELLPAPERVMEIVA
jgi:hypothetical protein